MKKFTIEFNWAIIYTLVSLLWSVLEKSLGYHDKYIGQEMIFSMLLWIVAIPVYVLAIRDKRKNFYKGKANWTQLFLSGVIMSVFAAVMSALSLYIILNIVSPDFIKNSVDYFVTVKKMDPGKAAIFVSYRSLLIQSISSVISVGVLISSIVALSLKTEAAVAQPIPVPKQKPSKNKRK